jgi:5S rRNA maturation endonuclease (ribonuclease M5)
MWGFFGWHTVDLANHKSVIITEGEYDAMAVSQVIHDPINLANTAFRNIPVISLPNGCNSLPNELIASLDSFDKIYLWMDYDKSGQDACEKFTKKLGLSRCKIVTPVSLDMLNPPKDANDALRQNPKLIIKMLSTARGLSHKSIEDFSKFRSLILQSVMNEKKTADGQIDASSSSNGLSDDGTPTPSLMGLTEKIKGFRRGELVVLSGSTGLLFFFSVFTFLSSL